jgi:hypothetical protein
MATKLKIEKGGMKLKKMDCKLNIRKYSSNGIIDTWNSLPNEVIAAKTVKQFEISLDKHSIFFFSLKLLNIEQVNFIVD